MQIDYEKLKGKIWLNGNLVRSSKAKFHVLCHSLHFGSAVFEGIRVYNKKAFLINEHIDRLFKSARLVDIKIPYSKKKIIKACEIIIKKQKLSDGYLRPIVWRGGQSMAPGIKSAKINLAIAGWTWPIYYSKKSKQLGISLTLSKWRRPPKECAPALSKCSSLYTICTLAKNEANKNKFDDALMLDLNNNICETTSSNIFFIKKDVVYTPKADCFLNGITRQAVIKICNSEKIKVKQLHINKKKINSFHSCFITGTAAEITPVKKIGNFHFKNSNSYLKKITKKFEEATKI